MKILSAKHKYAEQGVPALFLEIENDDGKVCSAVIWEPKPTLLKEGYVKLHSLPGGHEWEEHLPSITLPAKPEEGRCELTLHGFTDDPAIVDLALSFWKASLEGTFVEGVVER